MKIKRIISIVLLSLFASLFQGIQLANAAGVPTWGNLTSNSPNRSPDGGGCQWTFAPAVNENGSTLTNYRVTVRTVSDTGAIFNSKEDLPITPAQTSTTLVVLDRNFFSSFGAVVGTRYYFLVRPVNAYGPAANFKSIGNCDVTSLSQPGAPGIPTVVAGDASATITIVAPSTGNSPSSYTIQAYDSTGNSSVAGKTCTVTVPATSCTVSGLTNGTTYKFKSTATNSVGTSSESGVSTAATPTGTIASTITNVTSSTANGSYKAGGVISIQVAFNEAVTVSGTPQLTLETGSTDQVLNYVSGSGTTTLTFTYTIQAGDTSSDLTYVATNSLALNSGTIKNSSNLDAVLTLPAPTAAGSLAANKAIIVDTTAPSTPSTPDLETASDTGSSTSDNVTSDNTPTISVSGTFSGTAVVTATKAGSTSVSCTITSNACTLATLAEGTWSISVTDTDAAGNATTSSALSITIDSTAPTAALTAGTITSADNASVSSNAVGTAYLVNTSVTVNNLASITGAADSSWNSVSITTADIATNLAATGLTPGTYRVYTVDTAGNLSTVSTNSLTVTLAATGTPDLVAASDLGSSSTDNNTNDDTPEISLTGLTTGAVITLTATPSSGTAVTCTFTATGGTGSCTFPTLVNGTYSVTATQTYNSVTSSSSTALTGLVINKTTVATPATPDLASASDLGSSTTDNLTSDNTPTITVSGSFAGTAVVTASKVGSTSVSCTIASNTCDLGTLSDGTWSISVTDTDTAGNSTTSAALSIIIDSAAPTPTVAAVSVTTSSGVTVKSSEAGTAYLVKSTVTVSNLASITGAADNNFNQVTISNANTDTTMSTTGLVAGDYKLYVVDAAGNLSSVSANTVTIAVAAAPTSNSTAAPAGTTTFGSTLTNAVTFNGVPSPTLTYQWKSCTNATDTATVCSDISGATSSSFIANAIELVGKFIRILVTAINGESPNATAWSSPTAVITAIAPGVPTLGTPTLGDLQINVPVIAPASNGGSTITKYQFSTDGGATWRDRTDTATVSSPIVIKFLSTDGTTPIMAGTTYPVQIRAVNGASSPNGLGTASVSVVAATSPGAPTAVSATATGQTTATVSFIAPTNTGGGTITTYTVTSSPGGVTASGSSSPITVSGLTASTTYTFTVTATNAAATSVASTASVSVTTSAPPAPAPVPVAPAPAPEPVCGAACIAAQAAAAKVIADKVAAEAKVVAEKVASDTAAKVVADKVIVDKSAAEAAAKAAIDKATAAVIAKVAADTAALNAAAAAKAAADAQQAAVVAAAAAADALKSATTSAATKAAATATATKAAATAVNTVQAAATAAKAAATAKTVATNATKQVDIAIGALGSKTAAATTAAQANAIAAAAKTAANEAAKAASDQATAAKVASNNANKEAASTAASIATEQKQAADAAAEAKVATDIAVKATVEKIAAATDAQKAAEAVVKALEEKIALAEASVKAKDITERAAIDKKIEEIAVKVTDAQKSADAANAKADAAAGAQEKAQAAATAATNAAAAQAAEAAAVRAEAIAKTAVATKAAADASLAAKIAAAAVAAAAKVPAKAVIVPQESTSANKNSAKATISGLKPGQKVKVTVNVKGN